ncbi:potassium channel family protein [Croceicoccus bisphenolivorans]|uniref:potassium channel family protein n=1 Tax=Croceicoccus bisphenolivorans TaxID=1783232 RepID=UPI001FDFD6F6|nr:potassium channel family protein [Croceicoccus bisphenolivorans]
MTDMIIGLMAAFTGVGISIYVHFFGLRTLAWWVQHRQPPVRKPLLLVMFVAFSLHVVEVLIFSFIFALCELGGFGELQGAVYGGTGWFIDHFYFSIASYTTLGLGDIVPHGAIRMIAGVEALVGLVLVAWSASFTYLMMERLWADRMPVMTETEVERERDGE